MRTKSIRYRFYFRKLDAERRLAAAGELIVVSVIGDPVNRRMKSVPIPDCFRACIEAAPESALTAGG